MWSFNVCFVFSGIGSIHWYSTFVWCSQALAFDICLVFDVLRHRCLVALVIVVLVLVLVDVGVGDVVVWGVEYSEIQRLSKNHNFHAIGRISGISGISL